ncbi:uncharacterized protein LOC131040363 isoform X2 [Cryptomeria japonica]|uniref:uncharacterized protein LOC131040363 isoform X2 n=1 Tax=Cryptomeria japonica TaxID=3369 RepID=UPI0027DA03FF|nr:uncharacterized protein LOC131040363 isoform X2 [Cryptomeria japonica]
MAVGMALPMPTNIPYASPCLSHLNMKLTPISSLPVVKNKMVPPLLPSLNFIRVTGRLGCTKFGSLPSRRLQANSNSTGAGELFKDEPPRSIELPCLPFTIAEAMNERNNFFVHFVLDPVSEFGSSLVTSFAARYGCLSLIENVKPLEIGALVTIRGIGRVNIMSLTKTEPYLRGVVLPMQDEIPSDSNSVDASVEDLKLALTDLHCLQIKLKTLKDEQLQTPLWNSLRWAEKEDFLDYNKTFVPRLAERISFAALQPVVGATVSEIQGLLQARLEAMESRSTVKRLESVMKLVNESKALIAAKLAIQSLKL